MTKQELNQIFGRYVSVNKLRLQRNLNTFNELYNTSHTIENLLNKKLIKQLLFNRKNKLNYGIDSDNNIHYEIN